MMIMVLHGDDDGGDASKFNTLDCWNLSYDDKNKTVT